MEFHSALFRRQEMEMVKEDGGRESHRGNLQSYYSTKTENEEKRKEGMTVGVGKQPSRLGRLHQQQSQLSEDGEDRKLRCI